MQIIKILFLLGGLFTSLFMKKKLKEYLKGKFLVHKH